MINLICYYMPTTGIFLLEKLILVYTAFFFQCYFWYSQNHHTVVQMKSSFSEDPPLM